MLLFVFEYFVLLCFVFVFFGMAELSTSLYQVETTFVRRMDFGRCWRGFPCWPPEGKVWRIF